MKKIETKQNSILEYGPAVSPNRIPLNDCIKFKTFTKFWNLGETPFIIFVNFWVRGRRPPTPYSQGTAMYLLL